MAGDALVREFTDALQAFSDEDVAARGTDAFREICAVTAEAVVIGNAFGPGVPIDTGFLRASFRVAQDAPEDGPSTPPPTPGRRAGAGELYTDPLDTRAATRAPLGSDVFVTTLAEYAVYLEEGGTMQRRFGANAGAATPFIAPVEARFGAIIDDAAQRMGFGA